MDIELAVDAMEQMQLAERVDQIVLFPGDGDFCSLVEKGATPWRPCHRGVDYFQLAAHDRRRAAPPSRRIHRSIELQSKLGRDPSPRVAL
jgi:NYN domain